MKTTKNSGAVLLAVALLLLGSSLALAQSSASYDLSWNSVDGGGGTSASASYSLSGGIGQPDAGGLASSSYSLYGGLWVPGSSQVAPPPLPDSFTYIPLILK